MSKTKRPLPEGWRWMELGEVLTYAKSFFTIEDDKEYRLVTVRLHGKGIVERERLRGALIKTKQQQRIKKDQFLVAEIDAKVGAFSAVPAEFDGAIVSGHYFLYDIDTAKMRPQFLQCYVSSGLLTENVQKYIQGALNYAAIRPHHILTIRIPFPLPTHADTVQTKLVSRLAAIKKMQRYAERQLEATIALERQAMRDVFDFEDVKAR